MKLNVGKKAIIYTLPECPWCYRAKKLMDHIDLEYEEIKEKHPDWKTVPYILIDDKPVGGFTEFSKLLSASV
jgi:glutaredoxin